MSGEIQETQEIEVAESGEIHEATEVAEAVEETVEAEAVESEEEIVPPKRRPGRPKGKAKPKEPKKEPKTPRPKPIICERVVEPPWDMHTFSRALASHIAEEKRGARVRRHQSWDGFFL
jgi:hypothetical protein